jgi:glycosyltransferase involved in cell wall biosynthesis
VGREWVMDGVPGLFCFGRGAGDLRVSVAHLGQGVKLAGASRRLCRVGAEPVRVVVVADACTDQTAAVARAAGAWVISIHARRVGAARAAGMRELLRLTVGSDPAAVWLATTDADTLVPPDWLRRQLDYANAGWDVVLGTITVTDWDDHPPHVPAAFAERYAFGPGPHPHVHGANLGIRATAYLAAGGFPPLRTAEDHAFQGVISWPSTTSISSSGS